MLLKMSTTWLALPSAQLSHACQAASPHMRSRCAHTVQDHSTAQGARALKAFPATAHLHAVRFGHFCRFKHLQSLDRKSVV